MRNEGRIDYVEIPAADIDAMRTFLEQLFGWTFQAWGPDYYSFNDGRLDGGLRRVESSATAGGVLLIFYSQDLERDYERVQELGATISQEIFEFPGGRRFHFVEPAGTEFAIWTSAQEE